MGLEQRRADGDASLLVDTLFDVRLTAEMLTSMRRAVPAARHIDTVVNTHANGDHCWRNEFRRLAFQMHMPMGTRGVSVNSGGRVTFDIAVCP